MTSHEDTKTRRAMRIGFCALATLFPAGHAMAGWDGFPLSTNTATGWYSLHQAHEPMRQIVEACRERFAAVALTNQPTYVETYTVDAGVTNEIYAPDLAWYLTFGYWLGYDEPDAQGRYLIYYNGANVWVTPLQVDASVGPEWTYVLYNEGPVITNVSYLTLTVTITNTPDDFKFGEFVVDVDGNSCTGHAYVTHGLLNMLWGGLATQLGSNGVWLVQEHATNAAWYSDTNLIDYTSSIQGPVQNFLADEPYEAMARKYYMDHSHTGWTVRLPEPPRLSPAYVWDKHGLGRIEGRTTNAIGMVTGGAVSLFEPPTNLYFAVPLAETSYTRTNRVNLSTNDVPQWTNYYGWVSRTFSNEAGVDYTNAVLGGIPRPVLVYTGTNSVEGLSVTITGSAYVVTSVLTTNPAATNLVWNKDYDAPVFTTNAIPESIITNLVIAINNGAVDTLEPGEESAFYWHTIESISGEGTPESNRVTTLSLVWTNSAWLSAPNRLYAIQLDRLYYTLDEMRFVHGGAPDPDGFLRITNTVYGYMTETGPVGWASNGLASYPDYGTNMLEYYLGDTYGDGPEGSYSGQPWRNYGNMPDWWQYTNGIAYTNDDPYGIVYRWVPTNPPPVKAAAMAQVKAARESSWTTTNQLVYADLEPPYSWSIRQVAADPGSYAGGDPVSYGPRYAAYDERAQSAMVYLAVGVSHVGTGVQSRAFVMAGDYSGMYATNAWSKFLEIPEGFRRGPSAIVDSGPSFDAPPIEYYEPGGYWAYPHNDSVLPSPMQMYVVLSTGWQSTNQYPVGTIGSADIPQRAAEPMFKEVSDALWNELRGYQATRIWVVLEWAFEYRKAD